jgi:exosome complex RNA-binding protein Csl4
MCLACAAIEDELAGQEQLDAQTKLAALHEGTTLTDTTSDMSRQAPHESANSLP